VLHLSQGRRAHIGLVAASVVLCAAISALLLVPRHSRAVKVADVGTDAPDFQLPDLAGRPVTLSSLRGQAVVLFFAAMNSPATMQYRERVDRLVQTYAGDGRVAFLGVNVPSHEPSAAPVAYPPLAEPNFPMLFDRNAQVATHYSARTLPIVVVIDPRGVVRYRGPFDNNPDAAFATHSFAAESLRHVLEHDTVTVAASRK
jgi:peroxiredoxin